MAKKRKSPTPSDDDDNDKVDYDELDKKSIASDKPRYQTVNDSETGNNIHCLYLVHCPAVVAEFFFF